MAFRPVRCLSVLLTALPLLALAQIQLPPITSKAEVSNYEETSRYNDVIAFFNQLEGRSAILRQETFGHTVEGRAMPLVILSDPSVTQPREALESGKPVILVMANIHAGEVEGKEAVQHLSRRILFGDLHPLLAKLVILFAPDYNADGNEPIAVTNRTAQNGPIGGVGHRENAQGLDLNRDYMKMEAPETRALISLFNEWDPQLTVDLHTTDGSYHGYHLTYSIPLNPSLDTNILSYSRDKMMPALTAAMAKDAYRTYYYGNFNGREPVAGKEVPSSWIAFSQQPRAGQNYIGFRNRLTILSEAYSYLDFHDRIEVTTTFVEEILRYCALHADEIRQLTARADRDTIAEARAMPPRQIGVEYAPKALPEKVPILVGEVTNLLNPRSGRNMLAVVKDKYTAVPMLDYGLFEATRTVPEGRAYLYPPTDALRVVTEKLQAHGITVEELTAPITIAVDNFVVTNIAHGARAIPSQGNHREVHLTGEYKTENITFPVGTRLVRTDQSLGLLADYLLEPESDDGLVTYNFLDPLLTVGQPYPIFKMNQRATYPARVLEKQSR